MGEKTMVCKVLYCSSPSRAGMCKRTDGLEPKRMPRISNVSCREANGPRHGSAAVAAMRACVSYASHADDSPSDENWSS